MKSEDFKRILTVVAATALTASALAELITYQYDSAGRLTVANYGFGKSTSYQYDPAGNRLKTTDTVLVDSDNDGMADTFELAFFGDLSRNGLGDFDNDGLGDLAEYLAGTVPTNSSSVLRMERNVTNNVVQTTVNWLSVSGKTYRVQFKNSLNDPGWNDLPGDVAAVSTNSIKTDVTTPGQPQRFYRVEVVP